MAKKPTLVSLYSGCGGSAKGFEDAGFKVCYMNDNHGDSIATLNELKKSGKHFKDAVIEHGSIRIDSKIKQLWNQQEIDVIEAGFPCQGFSLAGPRKIDDSRNDLYRYLKKAIDKLNPKCFVAENVKGFVSLGEAGSSLEDSKWGLPLGNLAQAILTDLENAGKGYTVKAKILNAKQYGLSQNRERIIIVGIRADIKKEFNFPEPTHDSETFVSIRKTLKGIKWKKSDTFFDGSNGKDYFSARYMSRNRIKSLDDVSFTIPADAGQVPADPTAGISEMWGSNDKKFLEKKKQLKDSDWPEFVKNNSDKINSKLRRMSWKQCAAIQGFPEYYEIQGNDVKSKYRQVGNAVPPLLMQKIAESVMLICKAKT